MARKPRIHFYGAIYHVIARGNNKAYIFEKDKDKEMYKNIIKVYKEKYPFILHAYCIMDNHVHLLIEVEDTELSKIMQGIQLVYTQRYNKIYERTGHVFEQRYKALLCDKNNYFLELVRYIHQNPMNANITQSLEYKWSSHMEYITKPELVDSDFVLSLFCDKRSEAVKRYQYYMGIIEEFDYEKSVPGYPLQQSLSRRNEKETIKIEQKLFWQRLQETYKIDIGELSKEYLTKDERKTRAMIILLSKEITDISNTELSRLLGISPSAITKILSRIDHEEIQNEYNQLKVSISQA